MLVESMSLEEVIKEVLADYKIIDAGTTIDRLHSEYDKLRRRRNIPKDEDFPMTYRIKSHKKNQWIFILRKDNKIPKYKDIGDITYHNFVYYYNDCGLRALTVRVSDKVDVFNGHVFKRYNERMHLKLNLPEEILIHFFKNVTMAMTRTVNKDNRDFTVSMNKYGLILGEIQGKGKWNIHKTFISEEILKSDQAELYEELDKDLREALFMLDIIEVLKKPSIKAIEGRK